MDLARILDENKEVSEDSLVTGNIKEAANPPNSIVTDEEKRRNSLDTYNKNHLLEKLDAFDLSASIEALTTAISMKQIAISKESKKRSKADNTIIAKWHKEIESIERTIAYLKSI